jgi:hypothetical protein
MILVSSPISQRGLLTFLWWMGMGAVQQNCGAIAKSDISFENRLIWTMIEGMTLILGANCSAVTWLQYFAK